MKKVTIKCKLMGGILLTLAAAAILINGCSTNSPASNTAISSVNSNASATKSSSQVNVSVPSSGASLSVAFDKPSVNPGEAFLINILLETNVPSRGAQCSLKFDPSVMEYNGFNEGNFYKDWAVANGVTTFVFPSEPAVDNAKGSMTPISINIMGLSKQESTSGINGGAKGKGAFGSFKMTARAGVNKRTEVSLCDYFISDNNSEAQKTVGVKNGEIVIGTP